MNTATAKCLAQGTFLLVVLLAARTDAETLYVDSKNGNDAHPGTKSQPLQSLAGAASRVNGGTQPGPATIRISPGVYDLARPVVFKGERRYTEKDRLTIEAAILPDDPEWMPGSMPILRSTQDPRASGEARERTGTYGLQIGISHVTIRGLKFLGNPLKNNWHCPVSRIGEGLDDLLVTQCLFLGDPDGMDIYCPVLATGDRFVVDHCVFYRCHASAVFWDGLKGVPGKGCAMRNSIVYRGLISGVWTCQTAEDFEFRGNIIAETEYVWLRKRAERPEAYRLEDCLLAGNRHFSGYGVESGPTGETGPEVRYLERNVTRGGKIILNDNRRARRYLHPPPGSAGPALGAGLFTK